MAGTLGFLPEGLSTLSIFEDSDLAEPVAAQSLLRIGDELAGRLKGNNADNHILSRNT